MKKSVVVIVIAVCLSGCSTIHKLEAIDQGVKAGRVQGMKKYTAMTWNLPSPHKGPYAKVDDLNVKFKLENDKEQNATFFLGKSRETGKWEVFYVMFLKDGKWETIPVAPAK